MILDIVVLGDSFWSVKYGFFDWYVVIFVGFDELLLKILWDIYGIGGEVLIIGMVFKVILYDVVFVNGVMFYVFDYDDVIFFVGYLMLFLMLVLLVVVEVENKFGYDVLMVYIVGFEVVCFIGVQVMLFYYVCGFYLIGMIGVFGVVVGVLKLMGLSVDQMEMVLGLVGV